MGKMEDLTNKQFGHWRVLSYAGSGRWNCQCSCGVIKQVFASSLKSGKSTSCGHVKKEQAKGIIGNTFGDLTPIEYIGEGKFICKCICGNTKVARKYDLENRLVTSCGHRKTSRDSMIGKKYGEWEVLKKADNGKLLCRCSCGTEREVAQYSLKNGTSTNCGCKNKAKLEGRQFGSLQVIEQSSTGKWICKCECGNIIEVIESNLLSGGTRSCGCKTIEFKQNTMIERYGDTATSRVNNTRSEQAIRLANNCEELKLKLIDMQIERGELPKSWEVAELLEISRSSANRIILKYGLSELIKSGVYGAAEDGIVELIQSMGVENIQRHNRKILNGYELDIYLPDFKIAIEFNGSYWHSDKIKDKKYHQWKTKECASKGIRLIHIFEYEWLNDNIQEKLIELLHRILMAQNNKIYYARKLKIQEISGNEADAFIDAYHIQGKTHAPINIGLQTELGELLGVMTFGTPRFNRDNYEYELIRLAYKNGVVVTGGAEKMFSYFLKNYNPNSIISYCDISKFNGGVYQRLGFTATVKDFTDPNYVWIDHEQTTVLKRYQTMKHKLLAQGFGDESMTEVEIMESRGFTRIYDCGNLRFSWYRNIN